MYVYALDGKGNLHKNDDMNLVPRAHNLSSDLHMFTPLYTQKLKERCKIKYILTCF